jgi:predicted ATPase
VIDEYVGQPELAAARNALPWRDLAAFLRRAIGNAIADHAAAATRDRRMFCDRGLVDAATIASCHQIDSR